MAGVKFRRVSTEPENAEMAGPLTFFFSCDNYYLDQRGVPYWNSIVRRTSNWEREEGKREKKKVSDR
jgi:hypothetical protein